MAPSRGLADLAARSGFVALRDVGRYHQEFAHLDADLQAVEAEFLDSGGEFLVGEIDSDIVAMGAVQPSTAVDRHEAGPDTGVIRRMRVDPNHQRQGYGSRILSELESRAAALGFDRLVLDTMADQTAAIGLYESFGYEEQRRESTPAGERRIFAKAL